LSGQAFLTGAIHIPRWIGDQNLEYETDSLSEYVESNLPLRKLND